MFNVFLLCWVFSVIAPHFTLLYILAFLKHIAVINKCHSSQLLPWEECGVFGVWPLYYLTLIIEWLSVNPNIVWLKESPLHSPLKTTPQVSTSICDTRIWQCCWKKNFFSLVWPPLPAAKLVHSGHFVLTKQQCNWTPCSLCFMATTNIFGGTLDNWGDFMFL